MRIRIPCSIFHQTGAEGLKDGSGNGFPAEQLPLNLPKFLKFPVFFHVTGNLAENGSHMTASSAIQSAHLVSPAYQTRKYANSGRFSRWTARNRTAEKSTGLAVRLSQAQFSPGRGPEVRLQNRTASSLASPLQPSRADVNLH